MSLDYEFEGEPRVSYRLVDTRISLDVIISDWLNGVTPESIAENYSPLPLETVYGAITFYLANREMIDEYLRQGDSDGENLRVQLSEQLRASKPELYYRLQEERKRRGLISEY